MADNFNFKNFLFENKLGAYSKLKEGPQPGTMTPSDWSKVYTGTPQTGGDPYADFRVLTTPIENVIPIEYKRDRKDRGWQYMAIPKRDLARRLRNGYLQLPTGDNYLIGKEMEALLNQLATGEPQQPAETGEETQIEEAILYSTIEKVEEVIDNRLMQTALDAIADLLMDLESKKDSEGEKITHEEALAYLQMKMKEYLGDWK